MGSRWGSSGSVGAPALTYCAAAVVLVLGLLLGQCECQAGPQVVLLGGAAGWTNTANVNYTQFMSSVQFKAGDSLRFNNTDTKDHNILQVYSQGEYDACISNNNSDWTINPGAFYDLLFPDAAYEVWIMDTQYCVMGQKVEFTVLTANGTAISPDNSADPPSLNAQQPDPTSPPAPPLSPLGEAGGPIPNNASPTSRAPVQWAALASLLAACYFAAPAVQGF